MKIFEFFLHHAKLNYTLSLFLLIAGIYSYQALPRELFPPLNVDEVFISGAYAGASAEILDKIAVSELEEEINAIPQITKIRSFIQPGAFYIIATLKEGSDKFDVLGKVKDAISLTRSNLPSDMDEPVATIPVHKIPLMQLSISSQTLEVDELLRHAREIKKIFAAIPHLSDVALYGDSDREIQVRFDSAKIEAYSLNPQEVLSALNGLSYIFPLGKIESTGGHFYLSTIHGKKDPQALGETLIKIGGKQLRLRDISTITIGYGKGSTLSSFNAKRSFSINISKDDEGDALALSKLIKSEATRLNEQIKDIEIEDFLDTSVYIKSRLNTVVANITLGFLLVSLCMLWLINPRIALVVALGIPFSFILGSIFFKLSGDTINIISLLGALIAIGILVDDAIIVSENIQRHIEEGIAPKEAALRGTKEVITPVLVAAATTICAFLPMLLMSGEIGEFMRLIPTAVAVLLLASLVESFFFLPLHCAHVLSRDQKTRDWSKINALYHRSLHFLFDHRRLFLGIALVLIPLAIIFSFIYSKYQLITQFDGTEVYVSGRLSGNHTIEETYGLVNKLEVEILRHKGEFFIRSTSAISGIKIDKTGESEAASNLFHIFLELEDAIEDNFVERYITPILSFSWGENARKIRTLKSYEIEKQLQARLEDFKNTHPFEELKVSSPSMGITKHDVEVTLMGKNEEVATALNRLQSLMEGIKGVKGVYQQSQQGIAQIKLSINPYGESLGLNEGNLGAILGDYFLSSKRGKSLDDDGVIYLRAEELHKDELQTLQSLRLVISGKYVRLDEVVSFKTEQASEKINKIGGEREQSIYADVLPNELTSFELLEQINDELKRIEADGISVRLGGEQEKNDQFIEDMIVASALALSLIFLTLLLMFDSFLISFAILSVIPLSFLGVLLGHFILGLNLSMSSFVGILGLAGVVINDGIVMIDFIRKANSKEEFFAQATKRLRPILLTSITTFIGLATLIFFPSGQATTLQPLAVSLGFGLAWGTVLNLYYLPLLFVLLHSLKRPDFRALGAFIHTRLNKNHYKRNHHG